MDFIEVPEIANVVTVEGSPCMSPMDQDHLIYQQLYSSGEKSGDIKGYECYGDSPDHGYESDTINQKTCFNDFTEGRFTDILTPSTGTYNCTSAPMLGSNVSTMMPVTTIDEGPAPLKIEPSDDFAGWTSGTESYSELDYIDLTIDSLSALSSTSIANYDVTTTCNMTYASPQLFQQPVSKCEPTRYGPTKLYLRPKFRPTIHRQNRSTVVHPTTTRCWKSQTTNKRPHCHQLIPPKSNRHQKLQLRNEGDGRLRNNQFFGGFYWTRSINQKNTAK
uniref:uncharacterized protein LOC120339159 n=1 Tax=Styela clava TaxID=7725 RepID=UPI0019399FF7|nr:uncharacterized protein LOC120339159 [Styela clava]